MPIATTLAEYEQEVIASHAIVVAAIMAGDRPSPDTLLQLAAETITVDRLAVLLGRQVKTIAASHDCWQNAYQCFAACAKLWSRLSRDDDSLVGHRRLLERLICNAQERTQFYTVTDADRHAFNAQRDHELPAALA
jgi:hypothetical protein